MSSSTMTYVYHGNETEIVPDDITKVIIDELVSVIPQYAFAGHDTLKEIVIPSNVTEIGDGAFSSCSNVKAINFGLIKLCKSIDQYINMFFIPFCWYQANVFGAVDCILVCCKVSCS